MRTESPAAARSSASRPPAAAPVHPSLLVELRRFAELRVSRQIVLDPELGAGAHEKGFHAGARLTRLIDVELERGIAVHAPLLRVVIQISREQDGAGLRQL